MDILNSSRSFRCLFLLCMAVVFGMQLRICVNKYLDFKIVEDVLHKRSLTAVLPAITFCPVPGWKEDKNPLALQTVDELCPNQTDYVACFEKLTYSLEDLVLGVTDGSSTLNLNSKAHWSLAPFNIVMGRCYTYYDNRSVAAGLWDLTVFGFNTTSLASSPIFCAVHSPDAFVTQPLTSSPPQQVVIHNPQPLAFSQLSITVKEYTTINTDESPCITDPSYKLIECLEKYVRREVACSSPWDMYPEPSFPNCTTAEDFNRLLFVHKVVSHIGSPVFHNMTGCLPPCTYEDFDILRRNWVFNIFNLGYENPTGISMNFLTTDKTVIKQTYLYDINSLVGEAGGSLGLFLGASCISIFNVLMHWKERIKHKLLSTFHKSTKAKG